MEKTLGAPVGWLALYQDHRKGLADPYAILVRDPSLDEVAVRTVLDMVDIRPMLLYFVTDSDEDEVEFNLIEEELKSPLSQRCDKCNGEGELIDNVSTSISPLRAKRSIKKRTCPKCGGKCWRINWNLAKFIALKGWFVDLKLPDSLLSGLDRRDRADALYAFEDVRGVLLFGHPPRFTVDE